jgi:hypothetical protein
MSASGRIALLTEGLSMDCKITDLQLIYGVAGARGKFDDLVGRLVKTELGAARRVRVKKGDGGIDVYVGDLNDPAGIDVFQAKFFWQGLGPSQKAQIRNSFRRCARNKKFKTKSWTLCIPVDLSLDEKEWFDNWKAEKSGIGIDIKEPWGGLILESLLDKDENRSVKERYFRQEYVTQIRKIHGTLGRLVRQLEKRFRKEEAERDAIKNSGVLAEQTEYLDTFVGAIRHAFERQTRPPAQSMSDMYEAKQRDDQERIRILNRESKRVGHWEFVIRPGWISSHPRFGTLAECWSIIEKSQVRSDGWEFPCLSQEGRETGHDYIGLSRVSLRSVERWAFSQRAPFVFFGTIFDDDDPTAVKEKPRWLEKGDFSAEWTLDIDVTIRMITHAFRFATGLAEFAFDPGDGDVQIAIRLEPTKGRVLYASVDPDRVRQCYRASAPFLEKAWDLKKEQLRANPDGLAASAIHWLFERFNWSISTESIEQLQRRIFMGH